jgi:hypothetical protein
VIALDLLLRVASSKSLSVAMRKPFKTPFKTLVGTDSDTSEQSIETTAAINNRGQARAVLRVVPEPIRNREVVTPATPPSESYAQCDEEEEPKDDTRK